jgi:hypothetical protein
MVVRTAWAGVLLVTAFTTALIVREIRQAESRGVALHLAIQRLDQARQRLQRAEQTLARTKGESAAHSGEVSAATEPLPSSARPVVLADTKDGTVEGMGTDKLAMRTGKIAPEVAEASDPFLRSLSLQIFDVQFEWIWGDVLRQLNLPAEKTTAFQGVLRAHEERRLDLTAVAGEQGLELNDPAIQQLRRADGALLAEQLLALLGPDGARVCQQFRSEMGVMAQITGIAEATYRTDTPLTFEESRQLRSILAAHSEWESNGFVRPNSVNGEAALAEIATSGIFSAATVDAFRHQLADEKMHRQIDQRLNEIGSATTGVLPGDRWVPYFPALRPKP